MFFAFGDQRAHAGLRVKTWNARTTGADAFGERALRVELEREFAREILPLEGLVFPDVRADHLGDLAGLKQQSQPEIVHPGIVGNGGDACHAGIAQRDDQVFGNAAKTEAARHDRHAVEQEPLQRRLGALVNLFHREPARLDANAVQ